VFTLNSTKGIGGTRYIIKILTSLKDFIQQGLRL
jgi:hypothetical protein